MGDEFEDVAVLLSAGFEDAEQGLDEAAAGGALGTEESLAPDDGVTQGALRGVVGRLHVGVFQESPEVVAAIKNVLAHAVKFALQREGPFFESFVDWSRRRIVRQVKVLSH